MSLCRKLLKMCENVIAETFSKQNILKNEQVCMEPPGQPPKSVFRLHETTVFANGTGPSKLRIWVQKLIYCTHFGARNADLGSKLSYSWVGDLGGDQMGDQAGRIEGHFEGPFEGHFAENW